MSQISKLINSVGVAFFCTFVGSALGQEITNLRVSKSRIDVGNAVDMQIEFTQAEGQNKFCGLEITYGDGTAEEVRVGVNGEKDFPYKFSHKYANPGAYGVRIAGKLIFRGLGTAVPCGGDEKTVTVTVVDPALERSKMESQRQSIELDRRARELAEQEAKLRKLSEELNRAQAARAASRPAEPAAVQPSVQAVPSKAPQAAPKQPVIDPFK